MKIIEKLKFKLLTSPNSCRWVFNLWPPYWGTGIKVMAISNDFKQVDLVIKLRFYNRNYINTQFGGSLFSMTDPFFTFMLLNQVGGKYIICDKSAFIDFVTYGKHDVKATLKITDEEIETIKRKTADGDKYFPEFYVDLVDAKTGEVVAHVKRTLYVRKKRAHR